MKVTVRLTNFKEGAALLKAGSRRFKSVVKDELRVFSEEAVQRLKEMVLNNELNLPPKRRPDGKPPLYDSGKYISSYKVEMTGNVSSIGPTGLNDNMSNEELANILEFGDGMGIPPRPHLRPLGLWIERKLPTLAERIVRNVLSGSG